MHLASTHKFIVWPMARILQINFIAMKILLEINDNKADFFMELLKSFKFVKRATPLTNAKAEHIQDIKEAINELKLLKEGKLKGISVKDLLDEL